MRVSLYPHELAIVERLTVELTRLRQNECSHLCIENVGPETVSYTHLVPVLRGTRFMQKGPHPLARP